MAKILTRKREEKEMKKTIIILSISFTLILAGILYGKSKQPNEVETVMEDQLYMNQYPDPIPDPVLY